MTFKHISKSEQLRSLVDAYSIGASKALLKYIEGERDKLRRDCENDPGNVKNPMKLAQINILNQLLDLPRKANEYISKLPEGE